MSGYVYLFFVMPYMGLCKVVFKMVYCTLTLRIIRSVYINHFETTTNPDYMRGHNQKKDTHALDFDVTLPIACSRLRMQASALVASRRCPAL